MGIGNQIVFKRIQKLLKVKKTACQYFVSYLISTTLKILNSQTNSYLMNFLDYVVALYGLKLI